ncbi:Gag-pro-like protein [Gossypium australe]|uniref:Gag-pro-like protein n=1 Tax=Gossypium australe TaxID=47621 RepID=A0A5B6WQP2_9ROSI|nr:Gag-pro-like protein [Gossypium australe]
MTELGRAIVELPKQLEDRYKWLEKKFRVMESVDYFYGVDAKELSLVPNLVLPLKFKTPEFEKYNGTSCPEAHITMFYRRMTGYVNNDQLLIHYFQDSLIGSATKWYNQLSHAKINSWKDLAQAFMKQYSNVTDMTYDRITLQNMKKKQSEKMKGGGNTNSATSSGEGDNNTFHKHFESHVH